MSLHVQFLIDKPQELLDRLYTQNGPCCAGCDWWHYYNSLAGECRKSAPVSGVQRVAMLGAYGSSLSTEAGGFLVNDALLVGRHGAGCLLAFAHHAPIGCEAVIHAGHPGADSAVHVLDGHVCVVGHHRTFTEMRLGSAGLNRVAGGGAQSRRTCPFHSSRCGRCAYRP